MLTKQFRVKNLNDLEKLVKLLLPYLKPNIFLLLSGELGVGKTALTKLIAKHLKIEKEIISPTFSILQQYPINKNCYLNHFDFFRLSPKDDLNIFADLIVDNINIIEWPKNNPQFWQDKDYVEIEITRKEDENRSVKIYLSDKLQR